MFKTAQAALLAMFVFASQSQGEVCKVGEQHSGPDYPFPIMSLNGIDAKWYPGEFISNFPAKDVEECIKMCHHTRTDSDTQKRCAAFGYQEGLFNCDIYNKFPYRYDNQDRPANYGKLYAGQINSDCGSFNFVREDGIKRKDGDCCEIYFQTK